MTSYIFKNKTKNILAIVFTILSILNSNLVYNIYNYFIHKTFPFNAILGLVPYIFVLVYLFTLKKEYQFKEYLFPAAFLIFIVRNIYSTIISLITNINMLDSLEMVLWYVYAVLFGLIAITGYVLSMLGAINNFKNVQFLRIGMIVLMAVMFLMPIVEFFLVGGFDYFANVPSDYLTVSFFRGIIRIILNILFFFGIFNLTLNKPEPQAE